MNRQPIIGVTPLVDAAKESYWMLPGYFNGILQAGGLPLMLPLTTDASRIAQLCHFCDGILLTGGQDIQPELYGAEPLPCCGECSPERDKMELQLLELAFQQDLPVLGICRGLQLLNVCFGGTLYQDLPSEYADTSVCHMQAVPGYVPTHTVRVEKGSFVAVATGMDTLRTNSFHHQAVKRVADGFRVAATATDGVVEAIEDPDRGFFGTQFHPEDHTVAGDTVMVKFFEFLVREAGKKAR